MGAKVDFLADAGNVMNMRWINASLLLAGCLVLGGCGDDKATSTSTGAPVAAAPAPETPQDGYLGAVVHAQQSAVKRIDTSSLNHQVQLFNAQESRFPKDLNELVTMHYLSSLPTPPAGMKLNYDPATGQVTVVPK